MDRKNSNDDLQLHTLFSVLREQTVAVARSLGASVRDSVATLDSERVLAPGGAEVASSLLVECINLLTGWLPGAPVGGEGPGSGDD